MPKFVINLTWNTDAEADSVAAALAVAEQLARDMTRLTYDANGAAYYGEAAVDSLEWVDDDGRPCLITMVGRKHATVTTPEPPPGGFDCGGDATYMVDYCSVCGESSTEQVCGRCRSIGAGPVDPVGSAPTSRPTT